MSKYDEWRGRGESDQISAAEIFGKGVTPRDGERWNVDPIILGNSTPYPFADDATFGDGT